MGFKRGNTGKLDYDFDTSSMCEVGVTAEEGIKWYRVTAKRFRSWDGPRQLTRPVQQPGHGVEAFQNIVMETVEYNGPVYLYETNIEKPYTGAEKYIETITETDEEIYIRRSGRL
jgi:hypothetical protein